MSNSSSKKFSNFLQLANSVSSPKGTKQVEIRNSKQFSGSLEAKDVKGAKSHDKIKVNIRIRPPIPRETKAHHFSSCVRIT